MATIQRRSNPINIAPFVDLLLILFVIIIVSAKFDDSGDKQVDSLVLENQTLKIENERLLQLSEASREQVEALSVKLSKVSPLPKNDEVNVANFEDEIEKLKEKLAKVEDEKGALASKLNDTKKVQNKSSALESEIEKLKEKLAKVEDERDFILNKYDRVLSNPNRKNDLHINIDKDGSISLADVINGNSLAKISDEQFLSILNAMGYTNVYYYYPKELEESKLKKVLEMIGGVTSVSL